LDKQKELEQELEVSGLGIARLKEEQDVLVKLNKRQKILLDEARTRKEESAQEIKKKSSQLKLQLRELQSKVEALEGDNFQLRCDLGHANNDRD
jgi:predicted  nucleic acid-binding Zn-ribbon protein